MGKYRIWLIEGRRMKRKEAQEIAVEKIKGCRLKARYRLFIARRAIRGDA